MADATSITIYCGPQAWFDDKVRPFKKKLLLEIVYERDERTRNIRHYVDDGQSAPSEDAQAVDQPANVVAGSGDYASLNEHVISNFSGLVRSVRPKRLHLHNPPTQVQGQLQRDFIVRVERYPYPSITREVLHRLDKEWIDHLIGQEQVRERLLAALLPLTRPGRTKPIVLMLLGPSGVGKTETARFINDLLGGTLMRKQFSMYHSEKFASYLFGGAHSEPSFAHDLLDRDSGVILLDEFDKANSAFHSAFYQIFDEGVFEDKNYTVDLGPSLIICTTNYRSESEAMSALGDALWSRFDALIEYGHLSPQAVREIIDKMVGEVCAGLPAEERVQLDAAEIKGRLHEVAGREGNVRRLGKLVDEVVALKLVRSLFQRG